MQARCEQCGSVLPELAPGYVIVTCRKCGATRVVRPDGQLRRTGGAEQGQAPASRESSSSHALDRGALVLAPPGFMVDTEKGGLRIGWRVFSLEPILASLAVALGLGFFFIQHPDAFAELGSLGKGVLGAAGLVLFYPAVASLVNIRWLEVRDHYLVLGSGPLPMPRSRLVDVRTLRGVWVKALFIRRHRGWVTGTRYVVLARDDSGRDLRIGNEFENESEASFIAEALRTFLGLKEDPGPT
jgi:hypothetical protein